MNAKLKNNKEYDVLIIGGGVIGSMINYQLSKSKLSILQVEKNNYFADETSMGNSGLIHSGIDAEGEIERKLNLEGNKLWRNELLQNINIPHVFIPSLIVAFNKEEEKEVYKLYQRGLDNGLSPKTLKIIKKEQIIEMEPNIKEDVTIAVVATSSIAIDPVLATRALIGVSLNNGSEAITGSKVTSIKKDGDVFFVEINGSEIVRAKNIVNAAGHYADEIAKMANEANFKLVARRGEYRILSMTESNKVNNVVFKVPTLYGKGVIVAPMLDGRTLIGPTAEENILKEDARLVTRNKYDLIGQIGHDIIPSLDLERTEKIYSGSRPIYEKTNDFLIEYGNSNNFINVAGMQSPALSSSPAIARVVENLLKDNGTNISSKENFNPKYKLIW
ncbi:MAG: type 2 glycerol-3-phosphate oxidase [Mycoplasmataceae bacterium]|nr:type 2 glycerol-3-phosphate oxidase [Mycoplasmataceae bacterium]